MRRRVVVLVAGLLLAVTACSSGQQSAQNREGQAGFVSGNGNVSMFAASDRKPAPQLTGQTLDGKTWTLSDQVGKVVVLNVWGSWCPPCRKEARSLAAASRELAGDDVAFVGVNTKDSSPEQGLAFQRRYAVPYPSLFDPAGRSLLAFHGTLNPSAIPSTLVLDTKGRVAASILGEVPSQRTLVELVRDVQK